MGGAVVVGFMWFNLTEVGGKKGQGVFIGCQMLFDCLISLG